MQSSTRDKFLSPKMECVQEERLWIIRSISISGRVYLPPAKRTATARRLRRSAPDARATGPRYFGEVLPAFPFRSRTSGNQHLRHAHIRACAFVGGDWTKLPPDLAAEIGGRRLRFDLTEYTH